MRFFFVLIVFISFASWSEEIDQIDVILGNTLCYWIGQHADFPQEEIEQHLLVAGLAASSTGWGEERYKNFFYEIKGSVGSKIIDLQNTHSLSEEVAAKSWYEHQCEKLL